MCIGDRACGLHCDLCRERSKSTGTDGKGDVLHVSCANACSWATGSFRLEARARFMMAGAKQLVTLFRESLPLA